MIEIEEYNKAIIQQIRDTFNQCAWNCAGQDIRAALLQISAAA